MPRKHAISLDRRRALRQWAHQQHPKPTQKACIEWFLQQYNHKLSQSTVSESLSVRFNDLDTLASSVTGKRLRTGQWPDLEKLLLEWQQRIDTQGGFTSGDLLREIVQQIWNRLSQYVRQPCPDFSNGWLSRFKARHNIRQHTRYGEAGSVANLAEEEMGTLQKIAGEYNEEDIFNVDETGLYWKMMPSRGLSTQSLPGLKKEKTRITLVFCVSATGSDRMPVWIIVKSKTPRALRNTSVSAIGACWRWNQRAWMNTTIMVEWLQSFYLKIGRIREVLLIMDNFSPHYSAIEIASPPPNIRICGLPANSTSQFQPLDQGIIQSSKAHYRKQCLSYILGCFNTGHNPMNTMNLRLAIRWTVRSWNQDLLNTTICNCFRKSTLISTPTILSTHLNPTDLPKLYEEVINVGRIHNSMAISNFLNPEDEGYGLGESGYTINCNEILEEVISEHLGLQNQTEDEDESCQTEPPVRTILEAQQALQVLFEYFEAQEELPVDHRRALEGLETVVQGIQNSSQVQVMILFHRVQVSTVVEGISWGMLRDFL